MSRLQRFKALLLKANLESYLVTSDTNIRYLTGFPSSESWLIVSPKATVYLTDNRNALEAKKALKCIKVECFTHNMQKSVFEIISLFKAKNCGIDDRHISHYQFLLLKKYCPKSIKLVSQNHLIESLREIKDQSEIKQIRDCLKLNLAAYDYLRKVVKPGMTEQDVLLKLENYVKPKGAGFSFNPIIASGPNAAFPHARVSQRKIKNNEPVLIDMGIDINGYKSDLTRMFFLGKITPLYRKVFEAVKEAQNRGISHIRDGVKAADVDFAARNYLENLGLAKYFGHSLGHGVGLDIHEDPRLSAKSGAILKSGMVVTVEPGVYLDGQFGVRLEEMVLVTLHGCEVLSRS